MKLNDKSKFMSWVLRHGANEVCLDMDSQGYVDIGEFLDLCTYRKEGPRNRDELDEIVRTSDKKRFSFNTNHTRIRACQGHSLDVHIDFNIYMPTRPLYHGTSLDVLESICSTGIQKMNRRYVHLSHALLTAKQVGLRHVKTADEIVVVQIDANKMCEDGFVFYISENSVVLTNHVPHEYLTGFNWYWPSGICTARRNEDARLKLFEHNIRLQHHNSV
jgi:putative RNA 2'-phosphotransferase